MLTARVAWGRGLASDAVRSPVRSRPLGTLAFVGWGVGSGWQRPPRCAVAPSVTSASTKLARSSRRRAGAAAEAGRPGRVPWALTSIWSYGRVAVMSAPCCSRERPRRRREPGCEGTRSASTASSSTYSRALSGSIQRRSRGRSRASQTSSSSCWQRMSSKALRSARRRRCGGTRRCVWRRRPGRWRRG